MRRVRYAVGAALALTAICIAVVLSHSPISVARTNLDKLESIGSVRHKLVACQSSEVLPAHVSAVRIQAFSFVGPRVSLELVAGGRVVSRGERGAGWSGGGVTVPVTPLPRARPDGTICFTFFLNGHETTTFAGEPTTGGLAAHDAAGNLPGRIGIEYLRPARSSWWSLTREVALRMGAARAVSGTASVAFVLLVMACVTFLSAKLVIRELR